MDCFGLSADRIQQRIIGPLDVKASAGNIIFISGSSGSGKSLLLRALDHEGSYRSNHLKFQRSVSRTYSAGWLKCLPSEVCIFEYFAEKYSVSRSLSALSQVGLSEATAFIRPFDMLSKGQQYRAMLADLLLRDDEVWLLDEFCADLDPLTARVVAHNFRRHVMAAGRIAIVAAANHGHYLDALRPSKIIALRAGDAPRLVTYREYQDEFLAQAG
nr:ATP-binding cassette domain-containing protein [Sphingomonas anseongensis]